jgi:hypothetical protein
MLGIRIPCRRNLVIQRFIYFYNCERIVEEILRQNGSLFIPSFWLAGDGYSHGNLPAWHLLSLWTNACRRWPPRLRPELKGCRGCRRSRIKDAGNAVAISDCCMTARWLEMITETKPSSLVVHHLDGKHEKRRGITCTKARLCSSSAHH